MPNYLRGSTIIHKLSALNTGQATSGAGVTPTNPGYAYVGSATNLVVYIISDTSTKIALQAVMKQDGTVAPGLNTDLSGATWCNYVGWDNIAVTANTAICLDVSPFSPQYVRLFNLSGAGTNNITTLTVLVEANG